MKYLLVEDLTSYSRLPSAFELTRQEVVDLGTGGDRPSCSIALPASCWLAAASRTFHPCDGGVFEANFATSASEIKSSSWPTTGASRARRLADPPRTGSGAVARR